MKATHLIYSIVLGISAVGVFKAIDINDTWQNFFIFILIYSIIGQIIYLAGRTLDKNS